MDMGSWNAAIAAIFGGGATAYFAKAYFAKTVQDLETVLEKVSEIKVELKGISVKLEKFDDAADLVSKHDRKIAAIEAKLYGRSARKTSSGCEE